MSYTILAIDDEEICLEVIDLFLDSYGYKVIQALGGQKGIELLDINKDNIDLIMLDLMMPDLPGLEVLSRIRKEEKYKSIPIILQTGSSNDADLEEAKNIGFSGYIRKPYDCEDLLKAIDLAINQS